MKATNMYSNFESMWDSPLPPQFMAEKELTFEKVFEVA